MRLLDGELPPERQAEVETHVAACTECARDVLLFRALTEEVRAGAEAGFPESGVWNDVNRRLVRPMGWVLLLAGLLVWVVYSVYLYLASPTELWEKMTLGAIFVGLALLLGSVLREHYVSWRTDPYRHVQR